MANITITSDTLIDIENHFRVSAGPGAGKTHWLVNHIKNVLHNSDRLTNSKKIACITYTNVAVFTIMNRLPKSSNNVEVSTIHSFLYKHIIKPYLRFVADEYGIDIKKIDGHDETILSGYKFIEELKQNTRQYRIKDNNAIVDAISKARWKFDKNNNLEIKPDYPRSVDGYNISNATYLEYKRMSWSKGVLHHDDILFFSYQLINKYPYILDVIRAKFPYFFVDEFQDSNPIQIQILNMIGQKETVVGVIGDKAQSIFKFQGANPQLFDSFKLYDEIINYQILDNRRSSNEIINFLNSIRKDIQQNNPNNKTEELPLVIVGDQKACLDKCRNEICKEHICTLAYRNITSNIIKKELGYKNAEDLFLEQLEADSGDRLRVISSLVKSIEYARLNIFKDAIKEIKKLRKFNTIYNNTKQCLQLLQSLLNKYKSFENEPLTNFISIASTEFNISGLRKGKAKDFYTTHTYNQMAVCVNIADDNSLNRTIHKSKGDEFDNVLLILEKESDLRFITNTDLQKKEDDHRIMYVAASRAKKRLFISVPEIKSDNDIHNLIGTILDIYVCS